MIGRYGALCAEGTSQTPCVAGQEVMTDKTATSRIKLSEKPPIGYPVAIGILLIVVFFAGFFAAFFVAFFAAALFLVLAFFVVLAFLAAGFPEAFRLVGFFFAADLRAVMKGLPSGGLWE